MVDIKQDYDAFTYVNNEWQQLGSKIEKIQIPFIGEFSDGEDPRNISVNDEKIPYYSCAYVPFDYNTVSNMNITIKTGINLDTLIEDYIIESNNYFGTVISIPTSSLDSTINRLYIEIDTGTLISSHIYWYHIIDNLFYSSVAYLNLRKVDVVEYGMMISAIDGLKSNKADTYLKSDISTYINNLNLSTNFPNTDVTSLPTDKTLWAWLFNAILTELRNKATYDDLEDLIGVSERRYYANSKDALPSTGDSSVLYFVLIDSEDDVNQYEEYVWVNNRYELLGTSNSSMDLSNFYNKDDIDSMIGDLQDYLNS